MHVCCIDQNTLIIYHPRAPGCVRASRLIGYRHTYAHQRRLARLPSLDRVAEAG